jgi:hypothetical protein
MRERVDADLVGRGQIMDRLNNIPLKQLAVIVGVVTALAWIFMPRSLALLVSIIGGGLLALRSMSRTDSV